jgi:hypothetical protein
VGLAAGLLLGLALAAVLELLQGRPHESDRDDPGSEQDRLEREFSLAGSDGTDGASSERAGHTLVAQETHEE